MMKSKLSDICLIEKGKQIDTNLLDDSNPYKYINGGIKESGFYTDFNTDEPVVTVSEGGASCGYVGYVEEKFWCGCHCYKLSKCIVEPKYLYYALKSNQQKIMNLRTGATMPNIKKELFKQLEINVDLDRDNQLRVINELDNIQNLINANLKKLESFDEIIKSRFIEMFETIDLSEQKNDWIEIESISKIYTGTTPSTSDDSNWDGDILWITPAEMNKDTFYVYDTARKITERGRKSKSLDLMPEGTVLLSTRAPIGKVGIVGKTMTCNQGFKNFKCNNTVNPVFLYVLLKNNTEYLNSLGSGTTFLEVSKSKIGKMKIPVPSIDKQNEFNRFVDLIDKSKFINQIKSEDFSPLSSSTAVFVPPRSI